MNSSQRYKTGAIIAIIMVAIAAVLWLSWEPSPVEKTEAEGKLRVATTIKPLQSITEAIGGDRIKSELILPPGASPHTFVATPNDLSRLSGSRVIFAINHGVDDWATELVESMDDTYVFVVDESIELLPLDEGEGVNPHYWLSLDNGKQIARNITAELTKLDPGGSAYYQERLEVYLATLDNAKEQIANDLQGIDNRKIVTFHEAWPYFAEEFDLEVVGTFEPVPGQEPTARELQALRETIRGNDIKVIFSEPQLSIQILESFLEDEGVEVAILDPLGSEDDTYVELLVKNSDILSEY